MNEVRRYWGDKRRLSDVKAGWDTDCPMWEYETEYVLASDYDALAARVQEVERELEQVRVQLAGCLAAAEGATTDAAKRGAYGWSPAYQATLDLRRQHDRAMKMMKEVRPMLLGLAAAKHAGAFSAECPVCLINQVVELDPPHVDPGRRT